MRRVAASRSALRTSVARVRVRECGCHAVGIELRAGERGRNLGRRSVLVEPRLVVRGLQSIEHVDHVANLRFAQVQLPRQMTQRPTHAERRSRRPAEHRVSAMGGLCVCFGVGAVANNRRHRRDATHGGTGTSTFRISFTRAIAPGGLQCAGDMPRTKPILVPSAASRRDAHDVGLVLLAERSALRAADGCM